MMEPVKSKSIVASKTVWFNVLSTVVNLSGVIPPPYGLVVSGLGNVLLRVFFTDSKIQLRGGA